MELEDNKRRRRISEEEEAALLTVASPHLRSMIIAALDTGMRRGEMLALRFADIDRKRRMVTLRGATTKSRRTRLVPIGTARLLAVLEWLRLDSEGQHKAADVPIFSNEAGEPLKTFKKAWVVAVLKAHGVDPRWRKGSYKDLSAECQQRFRDINLHWHDLRHEYASILVERGVPLAQVRDLLGHASILTTERYDNQKLEALQAAVGRLEAGKMFDPSTESLSATFSRADIPPQERTLETQNPEKSHEAGCIAGAKRARRQERRSAALNPNAYSQGFRKNTGAVPSALRSQDFGWVGVSLPGSLTVHPNSSRSMTPRSTRLRFASSANGIFATFGFM